MLESNVEFMRKPLSYQAWNKKLLRNILRNCHLKEVDKMKHFFNDGQFQCNRNMPISDMPPHNTVQ